jgi:hypothetical protein
MRAAAWSATPAVVMCRRQERRYSSCQPHRCHRRNLPSLARVERLSPSCPSSRSGDRRNAANLPVQADPAHGGSALQSIIGDVVNFKCAAVVAVVRTAANNIAQHKIGCACPIRCRDARELPIQTDRPDEGGAGELVVIDVVNFQPAGIDVAQQQIGFPGNTAEIRMPLLKATLISP